MKMVPPSIDDDRVGKRVRWAPDDGLPVGRYLFILGVILVAVAMVISYFPPSP